MSEEQKKDIKKKSAKRRGLVSQEWLVRNIPFFLFMSLLAVLYIYNGHHAEKTIKDINRISKELKDLEYQYKIISSDYMSSTKQSEVIKAVEGTGIKEILEPPVKLNSSEVENNNIK